MDDWVVESVHEYARYPDAGHAMDAGGLIVIVIFVFVAVQLGCDGFVEADERRFVKGLFEFIQIYAKFLFEVISKYPLVVSVDLKQILAHRGVVDAPQSLRHWSLGLPNAHRVLQYESRIQEAFLAHFSKQIGENIGSHRYSDRKTLSLDRYTILIMNISHWL